MNRLFFIIAFSAVTLNSIASYSGKCGDNLNWYFDASNGELSITGYGAMDNYDMTTRHAPWFPFRTIISAIYLPNELTSIGNFAFDGCSNIKNITIPNSVGAIGYCAFVYCKKITSISIPSSVNFIKPSAFTWCSSLCEFHVEESNQQYCDIDGVLYSKNKNYLICYPANRQSSTYVMPNTVTHITNDAFTGCINLTKIFFSNTLKNIYGSAFWGCSNLQNISIPFSVEYIGENAFRNCSSLQEFHYPKSLDISKVGLSDSVKLIVEEIQVIEPPLLILNDSSIHFLDEFHNNQIDAKEQCSIRFNVQNIGKGSAKMCEVRVRLSGDASGIIVQIVQLPTIAAGQNFEVEIPISTDINTQDGKVTFSIEVYEPNGWGIAPFDLTVATKAYEAPYLQVVDYNITSLSGKVKKMEPFTLTFNLQNTKYGDAEQVKVKINLPANVFVMDGLAELSYAQIKSGEAIPIKITLAANNNYTLSEIPIAIDVKERYGKFAENKRIDIALNATTSSSINIAAKDEPQQERKEIQLALMTAEVDRNIPKTDIQNKNTFVVIIANENYQQVASVPFALNDGKIFRQYCEQTLGIPAKNIREQTNATGNQIKAQINWLRNVVEVFDNPNVIVYYAGHGIPDETSKTAYLLPVDGIVSDMSTCYKLDDLYATLGDMPAGHISVFMDACFSGSKRENGMLASARGVALKARPGQPKGNMVVFSAAQGDETAYPYKAKQHGMFTYYLLKKLQDTKGDVTLQELGNYLTEKVRQQSILENNKSQTPCVTPASAVADTWQSWKLK